MPTPRGRRPPLPLTAARRLRANDASQVSQSIMIPKLSPYPSLSIRSARASPNISAIRIRPTGTVPVTPTLTCAAELAGLPQSHLSFFIGFIISSHALEKNLTTSVIVSLYIRTFACDSFCIAAFSFQLIRAPQIGSVAEISAPRPPPTASPLPLPSASRQEPGVSPFLFQDTAGPTRAGPRRDKPSHGSRWPRRGGRDQGT